MSTTGETCDRLGRHSIWQQFIEEALKGFLPWEGSVTPVGSVGSPLTPWKSGNLQATQVIFEEKGKSKMALKTRNLEKSRGETGRAVREFCLGDSAGQVSLFNKKLDLVTQYMIKNILHEQSNQKVVFLKLTQK